MNGEDIKKNVWLIQGKSFEPTNDHRLSGFNQGSVLYGL